MFERRIAATLARIAAATGLLMALLTASTETGAAYIESSAPAAARERSMVYFERNVGQIDREVIYFARTPDATYFLTRQGVVSMPACRLHQQDPSVRKTSYRYEAELQRMQSGRVAMTFLAANHHPRIEALQPLDGHINYFIGRNPTDWHADVPLYSRVRYRDLFPGIDVEYYGSGSELEYDLMVAPEAKPSAIRIAVEGGSATRVDPHGNLVIETSDSDSMTLRLRAFQPTNRGKLQSVKARFVVLRSEQGRAVVSIGLGQYDRKKTLVIDPQFVYSSFLGGNGRNGGPLQGAPNELIGGLLGLGGLQISDVALDVAKGPGNFVYVAGIAYSVDFPHSAAALQTFNNGADNRTPNAFVAKFDTSKRGSASLVYSTFLGGSGDPASNGMNGDQANGIAVDASGSAYVSGLTYSADFPIAPNPGAYEPSNNQAAPNFNNGFVAKLSPAGDSLIYSTFINGSKGAAASRIAIAPQCASDCNAYVVGRTSSSDFHTVNAYQSEYVNAAFYDSEGYILVMSSDGTTATYASYLGGSGANTVYGDELFGVAVDNSGAAYVTGRAGSADFPVVNPYQNFGPSPNSFPFTVVAEVDPGKSGTDSLIYSTFFGGALGSGDAGTAVAVDAAGHIFFAGLTTSFLPVVNAFQDQRPGENGGLFGVSGFIAELDPTQIGSNQLIYSTYLGGDGGTFLAPDDYITGIAIDGSGRVLVSGFTDSIDFPISSNACLGSLPAIVSGFATELDTTQAPPNQLIFSSFLGGTNADAAMGAALDTAGHLYVAGGSFSKDFPITPNAYQVINEAAFNFTGTTNSFITELDPASTDCLPSKVGGALHVTPARLSFPTEKILGGVGPVSTPRFVTISNPRTQSVAITLDGADASGDFNASSDACPEILAPGASCRVPVTFSATAIGRRVGDLIVVSNASSSPLVALIGNAIEGTLAYSPRRINFPRTKLGNSSLPRKVTLANRNGVSMSIDGITIDAPFKVMSNSCGEALVAGGTCQLSVEFAPSVTGPASGRVTITDNAAGNPHFVQLSGIGF